MVVSWRSSSVAPGGGDRCQRAAGVQATVEAGRVIGMSFRIRPFPDDEWPEWSHPPWYAPLIAFVIGLLPIIAGLALVVWLVKLAL